MSVDRVRSFLSEDLWRGDLRRMARPKAVGLGALRVVVHAVTSFFANHGSIRAAGLTLITLLSLVPLLALAFAIANGLGYGNRLQTLLVEQTKELPRDLQTAIEWIRRLVDRTDFKTMGWLGSLVLAWAGFGLFLRAEEALNHVWKTSERRPLHRRLTDFIAVLVIVPVLVIAAISLSSLLQTADIAGLRERFAWLDWLYRAGLGFVPPVLLSVAFTALYRLMPSAYVSWPPAVLAGVSAAFAWLSLHALYLRFQIGVASVNAIYATLAALPLLLIYLQLTWTIVLLGAEVAYAFQNLHSLRAKVLPAPSWTLQRRLGLLIVDTACRAFDGGEIGALPQELAVRCDVPREWIDDICMALKRAGLLVTGGQDGRLMPARPPATLTLEAVLKALETHGMAVAEDNCRLRPEHEQRLARLQDATSSALAGETFGV